MATMALAGLPSLSFASRATPKVLSFYNRHTGETGRAEFWRDGGVVEAGAEALDPLLRDHRQNEVAAIDRRLYHLVSALTERLEFRGDIHVISGYRSDKTNEMLAARSGGVAKKSYHTRAMAVDIALPGIALEQVRDAALALGLGGVGYYPRSGFLHVDTGPVRRW
ncbi:DUF882 domain-containing protein [Ferrimonas pelagia]|uniref:Murein endopeptidase K n=1 Tax=Ferrimonas pelagia TaxID=1177826 RepID=A0ABP9EK83_9GAMM